MVGKFKYEYIICIYEDDLQLGKLKENCFATQALSQTQKNVCDKVCDKAWVAKQFSMNTLDITYTQ